MSRPSRIPTTVPPSPTETAPRRDRYDPPRPPDPEPMAVFGWD